MSMLHVEPDAQGERLDLWLSRHYPDLSRSRLQTLIREGHITVNGEQCKPRMPLRGGERIEVSVPPVEPAELEAEDIPLNILFEDDAVLVLNKPPGLVVHPAPGHDTGTLAHALLHHCADLAGIGGAMRPGLVHRLDQDTSGVLVVAKTEQALQSLRAQFKDRTVHKEYLALVRGSPEPPVGVIETLIGRSHGDRKKMSARVSAGRPALTRYEVIETGSFASLVKLVIDTGRTHQIRVHMTHMGHPILGDALYGRARIGPDQQPVPRQMLHAAMLGFNHPVHGEWLEFNAPIPADMREWIRIVREANAQE